MSINKLSTIKCYWRCCQFADNKGLKNVMARSRFEDIFRIKQKMTKVTKVKNFLSIIFTRVSLILFQMMILKSLTSIW